MSVPIEGYWQRWVNQYFQVNIFQITKIKTLKYILVYKMWYYHTMKKSEKMIIMDMLADVFNNENINI